MRTLRHFGAFALSALAACSAGLDAAKAQEASSEESLNPLAAIDLATLRGFLGRPVFSPSRRPPAAPATSAAAPAPEAPASAPPALRLVGIIRTPKESIAQAVVGTDTQRLSLRIGDFMDDWTVAAIDASSLTLKQGEREARFGIFAERPALGDQPGPASAEPSVSPRTAASRGQARTKEELEGFFGK